MRKIAILIDCSRTLRIQQAKLKYLKGLVARMITRRTLQRVSPLLIARPASFFPIPFSTPNRFYCEKTASEKILSAIPVVKEDEISDRVKDVASKLLALNFIGLIDFFEVLKDKTGYDAREQLQGASNFSSSGQADSGAADAAASPAAAAKSAAAASANLPFRKVSMLDPPKTVKEKFEIMKIMRELQPELALADVDYFFLFI